MSQWISIGKAAQYLGVSHDTLRRWEKKGKIKALRSPTNRRYYIKKELDLIMSGSNKSKKQPLPANSSNKNLIFILIGALSLTTVLALGLIYLLFLK